MDFTYENKLLARANSKEILKCCKSSTNSTKKPIHQMLNSVFNYIDCGIVDERLSVKAQIIGNKLIDLTIKPYLDAQKEFLSSAVGKNYNKYDSNIKYAIKESMSIYLRTNEYVDCNSTYSQVGKLFKDYNLQAKK